MRPNETRLVSAERLLEIMWDKNCRPSLPWLKKQREAGKIPFAKVGEKVFYDPQMVHSALFDRPEKSEPVLREPVELKGNGTLVFDGNSIILCLNLNGAVSREVRVTA